MTHHRAEGALQALHQHSHLSQFAAQLEAQRRTSIRLHSSLAQSPLPLASCKLGGTPDLAPDTDWPQHDDRPLTFLAQINCAQLPRHPQLPSLPEQGLLSFFYDTEQQPWGLSSEELPSWRVLFFEGDLTQLVAQAASEQAPYPACSLQFELESQINFDHPYLTEQSPRKIQKQYDQWLDEQQLWPEDDERLQRIGGYANPVQDDSMEQHCQALRSGQNPAADMQQAMQGFSQLFGSLFGGPSAEPNASDPLQQVQQQIAPLQAQMTAIYASPEWQQAVKTDDKATVKRLEQQIDALNSQITRLMLPTFAHLPSDPFAPLLAAEQGHSAADFDQAKQDWSLLLQLDSDPLLDWCWGDAGRLYFWIHQDDLAARRFDKVYLQLQCS